MTIWGELWLEYLHKAPESSRVPPDTHEGHVLCVQRWGFWSGW